MAFINAANTVIDNNTSIFHTSFEKVTGNTQSTQVKIKASDGAANNFFGYSVAVGSGRIVVGTPDDDDLGTESGSAYIFDLNGTQLAKIKASDGAANDEFGDDVAVGCGRIVVGSLVNLGAGRAYIFDLSGTQLATANGYTSQVTVGSGRIAVGGDGGNVFLYNLNGEALFTITPPAINEAFGSSVGIGSGKIVVGAYLANSANGVSDTGAAYIYDINGNQLEKIVGSDSGADDRFSRSLAVGFDRIVSGAFTNDELAFNAGAAYIYKLPETHDSYFEKIIDTYRF